MPVAPPKDTLTSPPAARTAVIWSANCLPRGSNALNQLALQPTLVTKAMVTDLLPPPAASDCSVDPRPMSTYGATSTPLPDEGGGGGAVVVVGGLVVGLVVGGL